MTGNLKLPLCQQCTVTHDVEVPYYGSSTDVES